MEAKVILSALSALREKYTPGERTIWDTMTRSAPLLTKVPASVMRGKSPIKMSCSLISLVALLRRWTCTFMGAA